jgi:hypothetical protein
MVRCICSGLSNSYCGSLRCRNSFDELMTVVGEIEAAINGWPEFRSYSPVFAAALFRKRLASRKRSYAKRPRARETMRRTSPRFRLVAQRDLRTAARRRAGFCPSRFGRFACRHRAQGPLPSRILQSLSPRALGSAVPGRCFTQSPARPVFESRSEHFPPRRGWLALPRLPS